MRETAWWFGYTIFGIWLQKFFPGLDFLAPALIVCLQLEKFRTAILLGLVWTLIQEGTGSLAFGGSILWYAGLCLVFFLTRAYLATESPFFILILSIFAGFWHFGTIGLLSSLQHLRADPEHLLTESLQTAIIFPILWAVVYLSFTRKVATNHG